MCLDEFVTTTSYCRVLLVSRQPRWCSTRARQVDYGPTAQCLSMSTRVLDVDVEVLTSDGCRCHGQVRGGPPVWSNVICSGLADCSSENALLCIVAETDVFNELSDSCRMSASPVWLPPHGCRAFWQIPDPGSFTSLGHDADIHVKDHMLPRPREQRAPWCAWWEITP